MRKFVLEVTEFCNSAFTEDNGGAGEELARILDVAAQHLRASDPKDVGTFDENLHDSLGNRVGRMRLIDTDNGDQG